MNRTISLILALLIFSATQLSSNCTTDNSNLEKLNNPNFNGKILFIRGGPGTGGFLEGGSDEQLADINNYQTFGGNHGWGQFKDVLIAEGYTTEQRIESPNQPINLVLSDLMNYTCVIFGSNNGGYTAAHADVVFNYISNGGSALFISDANFGSNWGDAPTSDQPFLNKFGWTMNQDAGTYTKTSNEFLVPNHPIFQGVNSFDGEGVSPISVSSTVPGVTTTKLALAEGSVRRNNGMGQGPLSGANGNDCALVVATVGNGRVAGHFDRNTFFNTNGAGTDINKKSNKQYARNLINWLTNAGSCPPAGTPCNDNNPNTYFDQQNGSCTCVGTPAQPIPSRIEAESYYQQSGIQTVTTNDGSGTKVGFINNGDTTGYVVDVANQGAHTIQLRASSGTTGGSVNVSLNGTQVGSFTVTNTGGYETFQTFTINATLNTGVQILSLEFTGAANGYLMDVNWIEFLFNCPPQGTACNDNDACTNNDIYDNLCNCAGTFQDADNDSVCDADDVCPNFDDTLIGTTCDDNNPATNNDVYTTNCICEGSIQPAIICLEPIHDAYLQGAGTLFNTTELRVEVNNRVGYLMYDLSNIQGTVTSAELQMTVGTDAGSGRIMFEKGATNNWTETTLSNTNKPAAAGLLGELTQGAYTVNTTYTWPLNGITVGGDFSIIMTHTSGNDVSFKSGENADNQGRPTLCLTVTPPTPTTQTVDCVTQLFLEGPFDGQNKMNNGLQSLGLISTTQPYTGAPWNYAGTETNTIFPANYIDWVLVSLRSTPSVTDEVAKGAVLLLEDGFTATNLSAVLDASFTSLYIVVEHRNHLPAMSPALVPIVNGVISHDFRTSNSYAPSGVGQKQIGTNWMLHAANADQSLPTGYEITGADNILWQAVNGTSGIYYPEDFNMDGDINGADKVLWSYNNGVFSSIPK